MMLEDYIAPFSSLSDEALEERITTLKRKRLVKTVTKEKKQKESHDKVMQLALKMKALGVKL